VSVPPPEYWIEEMAACIDDTVPYVFKLNAKPTLDAYVTRPTCVLPLSISNLLTSCDKKDLTSLKFVEPMLPDSSRTKTMSVGQCKGKATIATQ